MKGEKSRLPSETAARLALLKEDLAARDRLAVAFSGGVDSSMLLTAAASVKGLEVIAVTAVSEFLAGRELKLAGALAEELGVRHVVAEFDPLGHPEIRKNPLDRCYYCKAATYRTCLDAVARHGFTTMADGTIADDAADFRPGRRAATELGVISPLADSGMTKADVRVLSREIFGLKGWNRQSGACLASRFPPGTAISAGALARVEQLENALLDLGLDVVRARYFGNTARIETSAEGLERLADATVRQAAVDAGIGAGFSVVAVDPEPYRPGRLNGEAAL